MNAALFWLNERQWKAIQGLLPIEERGPGFISDRVAISGIIQVLRSRCAWRMCPKEYGPYLTIVNRYQELLQQNVWQDISAAIDKDQIVEPVRPASSLVRFTNILHVDDEPDIREVVKFSLGLNPNIVTKSCASGDEALAVVEEWQPDIILLDVMMPVMDGPATFERLRDNPRTAGTSVVFMTARAQSHEIAFFRSLGAAGVISKPFDPMTLADSMLAYV